MLSREQLAGQVTALHAENRALRAEVRALRRAEPAAGQGCVAEGVAARAKPGQHPTEAAAVEDEAAAQGASLALRCSRMSAVLSSALSGTPGAAGGCAPGGRGL